MPYFCYDKEKKEIWITLDSVREDLVDIQYATVTFSDSYIRLAPLNSGEIALEDVDFIVLNSEIVLPPSSFSKNDLMRMNSDSPGNPRSFGLKNLYSMYDLPFEKEKLAENLVDKGYIRTSRNFFLRSIYLSIYS